MPARAARVGAGVPPATGCLDAWKNRLQGIGSRQIPEIHERWDRHVHGSAWAASVHERLRHRASSTWSWSGRGDRWCFAMPHHHGDRPGKWVSVGCQPGGNARARRAHSFRRPPSGDFRDWAFNPDCPCSSPAEAAHRRVGPIRHSGWREIPLQAFHCRADEWVAFDGQEAFINSLADHYENPELIDWMTYDQTGTLHEHVGFGPHAPQVKERQRSFFQSSFGIIPETIAP